MEAMGNNIISSLFSLRGARFKIPVYQRAYSWDVGNDKNGQVPQFIKDLIDQPDDEPYYLGHFLFEKDSQNEGRHLVIDGQQRLTTVVIFFSCLAKVLEEKGHKDFLAEITEDFLKNSRGKYKFQTVDYDNNFFQNEIIENKPDIPDTKSKRRIREAKNYFLDVMRGRDVKELLKWKSLVEQALITTDEVQRKTKAAQLFTFQNDRGKDLTQLEKLKAFLMFEIYLATRETSEEPEDLIGFIQEEFKTIYLKLENINQIDEDQLLSYHCIAFLSTSGNALEEVKKACKRQKNKISWIKDFATSLKTTFMVAKMIEDNLETISNIGNVMVLDSYNSWPLVIKLFHFHSADLKEIEYSLELMEIILFRMSFSVGNYRTNRFHELARNYEGKLAEIEKQLFGYAESGFQPWWNFKSDFERCLNGPYHYWSSTKYLLWQYENHLRESAKEPPMLFSEFANLYHSHNLENTIDHWAPQKPDGKSYTEEFKENFLHNIGNLVLSTRGRNAQDNNNLPEDRKTASILLSRQEMPVNDGKWGEQEILERQQRLIAFAVKRWTPGKK